MTDQEQTERGASTFGCNHTSDDDSCPARVLYERVYQKDLPDLFGWFRFHHGWHARDADLERVTAENQRHWEYAKTVPGLIEEACAVARSEAEAERDAMREVVEAGKLVRDVLDDIRTQQIEAEVVERFDAALCSLDATRKATADATEEGK